MAENGMSHGARERLKGKNIVFRTKESGISYDAGVLVPENPEVELGTERGPYAELRKEWEKKNELLRVTEALGRFSLEGGQELITVFGAEKVAAALDQVLAGPIDERTGLYMLVRTLEPNLQKRKIVYNKMLTAIDAEVKAYEEGLAQMKTSAEREEYRYLHGGQYAPTEEMVLARKVRIREYQLYDRAAFTPLVGPLIASMERALTGQQETKNWSLHELKRSFTRKHRDAFVKGLNNFGGSLTELIPFRKERVARVEHRLERVRVRMMNELKREKEEHSIELLKLKNAKIEAVFADFDRMAPEALESDLKSETGKIAYEWLLNKLDETKAEIEEAYEAEARTKFGGYSEELDKLTVFDVFKDE